MKYQKVFAYVDINNHSDVGFFSYDQKGAERVKEKFPIQKDNYESVFKELGDVLPEKYNKGVIEIFTYPGQSVLEKFKEVRNKLLGDEK